MSARSDLLVILARRSARVRDEELIHLADAPGAKALFEEIISMPNGRTDTQVYADGHRDSARRRITRRRVPKIALAAALALALVLSVPAFGIVQQVKSWLSELKRPDQPVPTAPDVVIASGVAGERWRIVATQTDQGLCLFLLTQGPGKGLGGCGWGSDIRGFSSEVGDLHWVGGEDNGSSGAADLNRIFTYGVAAEGVASVELELSNGQTVPAYLVERPEGIDPPLNFFWMALGPEEGAQLSEDGGVLEPQGPLVHAIIARDPAGVLLEERIVDQPLHD